MEENVIAKEPDEREVPCPKCGSRIALENVILQEGEEQMTCPACGRPLEDGEGWAR